jgi:hypothetical protein
MAAMLSYEPELESLRPLLGDPNTDALLARDRREVFSLHPELRIVSWGGAMLLATAAGLVLKNNLDRLGPVVLSLLMFIAAASCYAFVWWRRKRAGIVDDYILLLGALLLSADVAFVETQFHFLGTAWHRHFLILAIVHGATAYLFRSRIVLSLSITALAAWLGVRADTYDTPWRAPIDYALQALACAALLLMWRAAHVRFDRDERRRGFAVTLEHFIANVAYAGCFPLMFERDTRFIGSFAAILIAALIVIWGVRKRRELFVLYGFLYAVLAIDILIGQLFEKDTWVMVIVILPSLIGAIVGLFAIHSRVKEWRT